MIHHGRIGANVVESFKPQSHFEISGPKVNSEFYPGWLDMWGEPHSRVDKTSVARTLDEMLAINASVNIYVFHGGTSFGFKSGIFHSIFNATIVYLLQPNLGALASNTYTPCITSYDYDAPLTEAGDPTEKYFLIRNVTSKV
jgi:beta-galactosidase